MLFMYNISDSLRASIRSLLLPSWVFFRVLHTRTSVTWGFSRSYNQAAQVPSSNATRKSPRNPSMNCRMVLALVSMTLSITTLPSEFLTAIEILSVCTSPSSQPPLLGAGPLRTGRDGFPSSGSGPSNASFRETRWCHGIECKQMQCLLSPIFHSGNSERAHRYAVRFRDVNTSQGLRLIAPTLEFMYGLYLLLWGVPNFSVHPRGFLALIFRHPSHGENFAAERVGQQTLQGSHLAPSAFLHRLHDTHLESANVAVTGLPINGVPFCRFA